MPEPATHSPRPALYVQLAATLVGFCVSTYFVSTIVFGSGQTMSEGFRWAIAGAALVYTVVSISFMLFASSRGYYAHKIEDGALLLYRREGGPELARIKVTEIESAIVEAGDGEILAKAEGFAEPMNDGGHGGEIVIRANGRQFKLHTSSASDAKDLAARLNSKQ